MGNNSIMEAALGAIASAGVGNASAADALMEQLYQNNPQVRQVVDQYRGRDVGDLLREAGVDPSEVLRRFGISR